MPFANAGGLRQYYRLNGPDDRPTLVWSHSLGCDHTMWDAQAAAFESHYRILRYDTRGHGATEATPGEYNIELLAHDLLALVDALDIDRFTLCGLSLGGMIGQWIGANAPERLTALIMTNTTSRLSEPGLLEARRQLVVKEGMAAVVDTVVSRFFTAERLKTLPAVATIRRVLRGTNPVGYAGCCAALRDLNQTSILSAIPVPTLIIVGDYDVPTPWSGNGELLARHIPHAEVRRLPAAHLSNLELPRSYNAAIWRFLVPDNAHDAQASGMAKRREILGDAHIDQTIATTTDLTRDFQALITRYAWGTVWRRPDLDDRTRRILVLVITATLGRWEEFRMHLRAGLARELEPCDVEEALLQVAIYAGVPTANTAFHIASEHSVDGSGA